MTKKIFEGNREAWLNALADLMCAKFQEVNAPIPCNVRMSIGFPGGGRKRIGECWTDEVSGDKHFEIFVAPTHHQTSMDVAATLAHELIHAAVGIPAGHGKLFKRVALAIGLEGKMRSTTAGEAFKAWVQPLIDQLGEIPHAVMTTRGNSSGPKKQSTRLIKCECEKCGFNVRMTMKWIMEVGPALCPFHGELTVTGP